MSPIRSWFCLQLIVSGIGKIDVDDWRKNTRLKNCSESSNLVQWFWQAVESYDDECRARLLQFVTGSSRVPINGFKALQGEPGAGRGPYPSIRVYQSHPEPHNSIMCHFVLQGPQGRLALGSSPSMPSAPPRLLIYCLRLIHGALVMPGHLSPLACLCDEFCLLCSFNRIDLPAYESYEKLLEKLTCAFEETVGFHVE